MQRRGPHSAGCRGGGACGALTGVIALSDSARARTREKALPFSGISSRKAMEPRKGEGARKVAPLDGGTGRPTRSWRRRLQAVSNVGPTAYER